jgi:hypothetical protein
MGTGRAIEIWGQEDFDRLADLFRRTRLALEALMQRATIEEGASELLATESLAHVEDVEVGFRGWLRASQSGLTELRALVRRGVLGLPAPRGAAERRAAASEAIVLEHVAGPGRLLPVGTRRLIALHHARLAFAMLPRVPDQDVRYPGGPHTYADIPVPGSPGELAERIEELERELWRAAAGHAPRSRDEAYRRTYGFFDVGERLTGRWRSH